MLTDAEKAEILNHISSKHEWNTDKRDAIERFIREELGAKELSAFWPVERGNSYEWKVYFDLNGSVIAEDPPQMPFGERRAHSMFALTVSRRGPYVTAGSFRLAFSDLIPTKCGFYPEASVNTKAVAWAKEVANKFRLHYVDSAELLAWKISEEFTDAANIFLEFAEPDGFNLLFYE